MDKFTKLTGVAAPLPMINIDTDKIFPAGFLKTIKRTGLAKYLFDEIRFRPDGSENPDFVLNQWPYRNAKIIVAGDNFGCGSSREHAPWALVDFGITCVIAPSFADIFYNNCFKNGILPAELPEQQIEELFKRTEKEEGYSLSIDLPNQTVSDSHGLSYKFEIVPSRKEVLLQGLDDIGTTLKHEPEITAYEKIHAATATMFDTVDVKNYSPAH